MLLLCLGMQDELNKNILDHIYNFMSQFGPQDNQYLLRKFSRRPQRRSSRLLTE